MKRIIISIFVLVLGLSMIPVKSVTALEQDSLIEKELEVAIVSGDGILDNPYVIDPSMAPVFFGIFTGFWKTVNGNFKF